MQEKIRELYETVLGRERELNDRMLRFVLLVTAVLGVFALTETCLILQGISMIVQLVLMLLAVVIALVMVFRYEKVSIAASVLAIIMVGFVFPYMFFLSGGIEGGIPIWFCMGIVLSFILFEGKRLWMYFSLVCAVDIGVYIIAYLHPEYITFFSSRGIAYIDSAFAVIIAGIAIGGCILFQKRIYQKERNIAKEQKRELEELSVSKEEFFANMSHELRTPINSIIGLNEMILRESQEKETVAYAENVQLASKMLLNLVNDILDFSQIQMDKMEIVESEYQTKELFQEIIRMLDIRLREKKLDFQVEIDEELPSVLIGDQKKIQQILLNVLSNAVKYTEEGYVRLVVYPEKGENDTVKLSISVEDSGIGIRKENLGYLFDTFRRVNEEKSRKIEGSGLGLAITKQLLDLMGGEIHVDSIYTKGSTFTISLEQKVADATPIGAEGFFEESHHKKDKYQPYFVAPEARVLVVDDNNMNTTVVTKLLKATKVQVDVASSGEECLEKTKEKVYHVILLDNHMMGMDGIETLQNIRKQENGLCKNAHCILATADSAHVAKKLCEENSFSEYLQKPFNGEMLEKMLLNYIPEEIVEQRLELTPLASQVRQGVVKRKKKVCITTDCICDLSQELVEKNEIHVMYLYIETEQGRFADTREIDSDNLSQFFADKRKAHTVSASVEDYEQFFADMLVEAEQVIHISMAAYAGVSYSSAVKAAKCFDHVHVIDSGQISGGQGLLVLYAAKMVQEGYTCNQVMKMIAKQKYHVVSKFISPEINALYENGYFSSKMFASMARHFSLKPVIELKQSKLRIKRLYGGDMRGVWKYFVRLTLNQRKRTLSPDTVLITHAGCSVKDIAMIEEEIAKYVKFEHVIVQKSSFSCACCAGQGTVGISYMFR